MKKLQALLFCMVLVLALPMAAPAADMSRSYYFGLMVNGESTVNAAPGDIITVVLTLERTDGGGAAPMYAMQNEIEYDPSFFRMVDDSLILGAGIQSTEIETRGGAMRLYMNYLSTAGGSDWPDRMTVGSFQLEVLAQGGVSEISNQNYAVSTQDGTDSFHTEAAGLSVVVSSECEVRFESSGGSAVPSQQVLYGEKVKKPEDPVRDGKAFAGWYRSIDLQTQWNFEADTVNGNMTLYAAWEDAPLAADETMPAAAAAAEPEQASKVYWPWFAAGGVLLIVICILIGRRKHRK